MSVLDWAGERFKDAVGTVAHDWYERAAGWADNLFNEHSDAQAIEIAELVRKIQSGYGSGDLHEGARIAQEQMSRQRDIADGSHDLVQRLESAWTGQSADAARQNIRPLAVSADDASRTLSSNGQNISTQAEGFDRIKLSVQAMADPAPDKSWFTNLNPFTTDSERAIDQYNQLAERNRQLYDGYHQDSTNVQRGLKIDYGELPDAGDASVSDFRIGDSSQRPDAGDKVDPGLTHASRVDSGGVHTPTASNWTSAAASTASHSTSDTPGVAVPSTRSPSDTTRISGYPPPNYSNPNYRSNSYQPGSFGPTGSGGYDPPGGFAAGGFGPVGTGGSGGAGSGSGQLGGGKLVGAGDGSVAGGAKPGAATAAGAAGARGATGMGGMGAGAGKGKGGEDSEHQRAAYLQENDPESIFGTDEKTVPPVIGG